MTDYTPSTASVRNRYIYVSHPKMNSTEWESSRAEAFDRWYSAESVRLRAEGAAEANAVRATWLTEHDRYLSEVSWDECERQGRDFRRRKLAWSLSGTSDPRPVKPKNPYRQSATPVPEEETGR